MNADVRAMKTPAEQTLSAAYESARGKLPGKGAVATLRADAFKQFESLGLPHRRVEEWKYTDLRTLMREAYPLAAPPDASAKAHVKTAGDILAGVACRRLVFVDGAFTPDLSDLKPETGVTICSMADASRTSMPKWAVSTSNVARRYESRTTGASLAAATPRAPAPRPMTTPEPQ
jgi:Fe-S cluster assembly protein SufD